MSKRSRLDPRTGEAELAALAFANAREAAAKRHWDDALEWLARAGAGPEIQRLEGEVRYRRASVLSAEGDTFGAEAELARLGKNAPVAAFLVDERRRLLRAGRTLTLPPGREFGRTCPACDGRDYYTIGTCSHQYHPLSRAVKLAPDHLLPEITSVYAAGAYRSGWDPHRNDPLSFLVRMEKDRIDRTVMQWLALLLGDYVAFHTPLAAAVDAVVPVPTSRAREESRGGEVPSLLAAGVRDALALPMKEPIVQTGEHLDHTQAHGRMRRDALRQVWDCRREDVLVGRSVLLVDDILTTGTTLSVAAELLLEHGVGEVHAVALLHTESSLG